MIGRIADLIGILAERMSAPIDEKIWERRRNRIAKWSLILGTVLVVQTAIVHSPRYVIGALYHERYVLNLELKDAPPNRRAKLLERLCFADSLFRHGGVDPYVIPDFELCKQRVSKIYDAN